MKITFTKCIYEDYEVDVPYEEYIDRFDESKHEITLEYLHKATKVGEEIEIDCIEIGKLDFADEEYQRRMDQAYQRDAAILNSEYLAGLI